MTFVMTLPCYPTIMYVAMTMNFTGEKLLCLKNARIQSNLMYFDDNGDYRKCLCPQRRVTKSDI